MAARVIELRDGSYVFDGEQPDPYTAGHLISLYEYDKAIVAKRMEIVCADGAGSVREQATHSVACDRHHSRAKAWTMPPGLPRRGNREAR